jgi:hypothetical protein
MIATAPEMNLRKAGVLAGLSYLAIFALGVFANFFVIEGLTGSGDAAETAANIAGSQGLFRAGIVAFLVVFGLDIVVAWLLHKLLRPVSEGLSLLAAWFRLVYTVFLGAAVVPLLEALRLTGDSDVLKSFSQDQLDAQITLALESFNDTWLAGLAIFGLHLVTIGYLLFKSGLSSKWLAVVLMVAGSAYVFDTVAQFGFANYDDYANAFLTIVAVPSIVGEFSLMIWLLRKAGRSTR